MSAKRGAVGIGAGAVLALTAGCGMLGIGGEEEQSDEDRLVEMLNESSRIDAELMAAELRIVQNCLEEQGFTVHDPWTMMPYEEEPQDSLTYGYPHEEFLLPAEEAAEWGFGQWANGPEGMDDPDNEDYFAAQEEKYEDEGSWEEPDTADWDALDYEDQYAWYVAYQGQEYATEYYGTAQEYADMMSGEGEWAEEEAAEEEAAGEDGEIVVEDDEEWVEPKPGGCQLEMIEALYGEPELIEETEEFDGETETWTYWSYRPENPAWTDQTLWEDIEAKYAEQMSDLQYAFLDCITARGYEGWEFTEYNSMPIWEFFAELYYQDSDAEERAMMVGDSDIEVPPVPEAAGNSYEDWKAYEIQTAVDFAECGEETDYAAASEKAYDEVHVEAYSAVEEDVYAWQEEMNDAVSKAQELLDK
ncbi:hypothetical protein LO763_21310 [Glycomyces sp. A-F 0318]|uniref:hypothetical protein n=1 Tax=Glycomyces amatae TaxID=2881355 RepID=UPI001E3AAC28|nr:hypothetical protein [Glycomyces amatae]MCD0446155.1 hypothetical protein [Glycomyces amatae]